MQGTNHPLQPAADNHSGDADSRRKVAFLRDPASYPESTAGVELIETHFAWIFLTDSRAWKLKKPIRAQVIDYRRLADRELCCREELRLNRRLADWVYLDVLPLREHGGQLHLASDAGEVVDWLVKMRRLPAEGLMDCIIARGELDSRHLERVARHLAAFHRALPAELPSGRAYTDRLIAQTRLHESQLTEFDGALEKAPWHELFAAQRRFIEGHPEMLGARARAGRIVEAHGDLRPEHIFLGERFAAIDCLEFSRDLRVQDAAEEIAFLTLELAIAAGEERARELVGHYARESGDAVSDTLMAFYSSRRAAVRAILSAWHLADPGFDREHYLDLARRYLAIAERSIADALSA